MSTGIVIFSKVDFFSFVQQKLRAVINELESLKPEFDRRVDELNREDDESYRVGSDFPVVSYSSDAVEWPPVHRDPYSRPDIKKVQDFKFCILVHKIRWGFFS